MLEGSWELLGAFGRFPAILVGRLLAAFGCFFLAFGSFWALLEISSDMCWEALGRFWELLGAGSLLGTLGLLW